MKAPIDHRGSDTVTARAERAASSQFLGAQAEARTPRRIGLHHIAFLRGYFEGLDVAILAEQYLALGRDKKRGLAAKRWIVEELVAAARKRGDAVGARLLRLPAGALPELDAGTAADSFDLETFREEVDPDGVYSESELVDLLKATINVSSAAPDAQVRRAQRNTRLRHRQRALLERLEHALAEPPRAHHPIRDWLDAALATRLARAGFTTLKELADVITDRGYRWYRHVPRVGEQAAIRILQWMERNAADLQITLPEHVRLPRQTWSVALRERVAARKATTRSGIAPIENFAPICPIAQSDRRMLMQWLLPFRSCPSTYRAYRSQAERLLLWAALERRIGLSAISEAEVAAFFVFVTSDNLPPEWCGPKAERQTAGWRPIEKCPSPSSLAVARRILKLAFDYLCDQGYCQHNPFIGSKDRTVIPAASVTLTASIDVKHQRMQREKANILSESEAILLPAMEGADQQITHEDPRQTEWRRTLHGSESGEALAQAHARIGRAALASDTAPLGYALRHLRLAVMHTLLNATAWPLSTLVQLRASHLRREVLETDGAAATLALSFHDGKRLRHADLESADVSLLADYVRSRDALAISAGIDDPFLIGCHSNVGLREANGPVTPNVLARGLKQFYGSYGAEISDQYAPFAHENPIGPKSPRGSRSLRTFRHQARRQLSLRRRLTVKPVHFPAAACAVDVRRFNAF